MMQLTLKTMKMIKFYIENELVYSKYILKILKLFSLLIIGINHRIIMDIDVKSLVYN